MHPSTPHLPSCHHGHAAPSSASDKELSAAAWLLGALGAGQSPVLVEGCCMALLLLMPIVAATALLAGFACVPQSFVRISLAAAAGIAVRSMFLVTLAPIYAAAATPSSSKPPPISPEPADAPYFLLAGFVCTLALQRFLRATAAVGGGAAHLPTSPCCSSDAPIRIAKEKKPPKIPTGVSNSSATCDDRGAAGVGLLEALGVSACCLVNAFVHGIVVAGAFASSLEAGVSTTAILLAHDLPHRLSDGALLRSLGVPSHTVLISTAIQSAITLCGHSAASYVSALPDSSLMPRISAASSGALLYVLCTSILPAVAAAGKNGRGFLMSLVEISVFMLAASTRAP